MSVSSTAVKIQYTANGVASTFTFPYYFISATDLVVKLDGVLQTLGADYTLEPILLSFSSGGRVIFTSVPALNQEVAIIRVVPAKQETDYANLTEFRAEVFEADLDKRALVEQQLAEQLSRAIVFPDTEVPALTVLPVASERAGQAIMFDMAGDMILGGIGSYPASAWAQTLLDDVDASAGLSTLGFSSWAKTFIDDLDGPAAQTTLGVSAFIKTLLDDADAATARATLSAVPVPTITQKSTDYVMADVAWCEVVNCTTGAGLLTVTLPTLADNQGSHVIVIKDKDSGAGEVMVDGEGAELLMYPGFTAAVGYVGLAGQSAEFVGMPDGWQYISGVVQPVAGEPSAGTFHALARSPGGYDVNANTTATTGTPATLDLTSVIPVGAKAVQLVIWTNYSGTAEVNSNYSIAWNYDDGAFSIYRDLQNGVMAQYSYKVATAGARNTTGSNEGVSTIGTSRKLYFGAQNSGAATSIMIKGYYI